MPHSLASKNFAYAEGMDDDLAVLTAAVTVAKRFDRLDTGYAPAGRCWCGDPAVRWSAEGSPRICLGEFWHDPEGRYEADEPVEKIEAAFAAGPHGRTGQG